MIYKIARVSQMGGRSYNEDCARFEMNGPVMVCAVADGLGGHGGGDIASKVAVDTLVDGFMSNPDIHPDHIFQLFEKANQEVLNKQIASLKMKSTAVALFCNQESMIYGHIGDSRLYRFTEGKRTFQTKDHSVSQMAVLSGEISPEKIRFHEDRNKVLRALGNDLAIKPDIQKAEGRFRAFESFLLCTDGFWEYVLEEEMEIDLAKSHSPDEWLKYMVGRLSKRVNGKNDNFTALAVFVINPSDEITIKE